MVDGGGLAWCPARAAEQGREGCTLRMRPAACHRCACRVRGAPLCHASQAAPAATCSRLAPGRYHPPSKPAALCARFAPAGTYYHTCCYSTSHALPLLHVLFGLLTAIAMYIVAFMAAAAPGAMFHDSFGLFYAHTGSAFAGV